MSTPQETSSAGGSAPRTSLQLPKPTTTATQERPQKKQPPLGPASVPSQKHPKPAVQVAQQKKISRRSSKPIINWFQRKLAGSGKAKRTENLPLTVSAMVRNNSNRQMGRITSSPLPVPAVQQLKSGKADAASPTKRKTRSISLNGEEELRDISRQSYGLDDDTSDQSSINRDSIWSPASALEADDDASVRPLPPSAPPSPSPSRSSSSYLSDPRTFRSMAASTKPTTLLSIDLNGGMAHIAQAPPAPAAQLHRLSPHVRQSSSLSNAGLLSSAGSITFSALPNSQPPPSRPTSLRNPGSMGSFSAMAQYGPPSGGSMAPVQAPLHTSHHPRNNPRPSSPPLDNASMLTLASSAFGMPNRVPQNYPPSAIGDAASHYGGSIVYPDGESTSHYVMGEDERLEERDFDASVRALRPRSSRRGSWESEASRWSARVQGNGTPSLARERSLWTSNSVRTGGFSIENGELYETADDQTPEGDVDSDKGSLTEQALKKVDIALENVPIINEPSEDSRTDDDVSTTAASESTGVNDAEPSRIVHRSSADTIAQVIVPAEGNKPTPKSEEKQDHGKIHTPVTGSSDAVTVA